jgi:hypothetical protein
MEQRHGALEPLPRSGVAGNGKHHFAQPLRALMGVFLRPRGSGDSAENEGSGEETE